MRKKTMLPPSGLLMAGLCLAGAMPVSASEQTSEPAQATVAVQGVQVAVDPSTGRLVAPTDAQRAALSAALLKQATTPNLQVGQRPLTTADAARTLKRSSTGRYSAVMQVPESLISGLVAERQADGSIAIHHQGDEPQAKAQEVSE
ncbi:MAG TPA: hypothetical protein VFG49_15080 [Dyella sp.]|uniref:post-PEP-CTERM-1 domain-containing protein n=1 Tax=Dyella sp. TaxID=1869338 RepID=UPI002D77CED6|nr:hypothetical protein [Dyella sp.]HET6554848.1 hypothetical protein [Dyella sp.]